MRTFKQVAPFFIIFVVVSAATFLVWPIEQRNYGNCGPLANCETMFTTELGGGMYYLTHLDNIDDTATVSSGMKLLNADEANSVYVFPPATVIALSVAVGAGLTVVAVIFRRVHRRRNAVSAEQ